VRRLARELGVDIHQVVGRGTGGRISAEDVKNHARDVLEGAAPVTTAAGQPGRLRLPDLTAFGEVERQPVSSVRRLTAESMARAWAVVPHVTQQDRADVTDLEALRKRYAPRVEAAGGKLTVTAIVLKVVAFALRRFPKFNAALDLENQEVVLRRYVHIGVAVDTERGLLVPVVRDADRKNITEIAVELNDLAERARSKKLAPGEMRGSGFTVSNLGGLGTTYFSPIVNWPEVGILGVGRAQTEVTWREGGPVPRLVMPLSISYDHRLIDGAEAARFLRWVAEALEHPLLLALEG
jgi:pyruvate dehydrogenase E2 component (dihydrolipoamide acetyltransferase)